MNYFNNQRLKVACSSINNFKNSSVLDLGAGTGFLYDHLKEKGFNTDLYLGVDISSKMLEKSNIPKESRVVANITLETEYS